LPCSRACPEFIGGAKFLPLFKGTRISLLPDSQKCPKLVVENKHKELALHSAVKTPY
jgi:hypothetical protein